jgi:hypothetical protein
MKRIILLTILLSLNCAIWAKNTPQLPINSIAIVLNAVEENVDAVVYPNPVMDGKFYVNSPYAITSIEVLNVIGQRIVKKDFGTYNSQQIMIELGNCEQGLYLVKITFVTDKTIIKKLLVK